MKFKVVSLSVPLAVGITGLVVSIPQAQTAAAPGRDFDPAMADLQMGAPLPLQAKSVRSPRVRNEIVVRLSAGRDINRIAREAGAQVLRRSRIVGGWVLAPKSRPLEATLAMVRSRPGVQEAFINRDSVAEKYGFVPNDPFYASNAELGTPGQYHLSRPGVPDGDVNVIPVWNADVTGAGIRIGIVDDGFDFEHPDLAPNFDADRSLDTETNSPDIRPRPGDDHGTYVAGCAIARGGNGIGVTGVAPLAAWSGIRINIGGNFNDEMAVQAIEHRSLGADRSLSIKNHSYGMSYPFIDDTASVNAITRTALDGTIHVFAAGNSRGAPGQDTNKAANQAAPEVIVAAALASNGRFTWYSCFGASVTVTAYGGDIRGGEFLQLSTDRRGLDNGYSGRPQLRFPDGEGNYAWGQGTSFTAPVVTGIMALAKQVQPGLNARWAKHLLARTSRMVDPEDRSVSGGWTTNAAGFHFNPNYGFGLIDASAFVNLARNSRGVTPLQTFSTPVSNASRTIPDGGDLTIPITVSQTGNLEEMLVSLKIRHARRGQLEGYLQSPGGTRSRLFIRSNGDNESDIDWRFMSNAFWGENPKGTWKLTIRDTVRGVRGTLLSQSLGIRMGQLQEVAP